MKAGDKKRGEEEEGRRGVGGEKGSVRVTDTETHRGWRRQGKTGGKGGGLWVPGLSGSFFSTLEYSEDDFVSVMVPNPVRGELSWV